MNKKDICKCGEPLIQTSTKPIWVHCENPYCDYVVMYGDWVVNRIFQTAYETKFIKSGSRKGYYKGSPLNIKITDIKKNYIEPNND
ncbi:hypothetical protein [Bacillus massiliigorillae]|uniref:hypothetical protein n=1 Tax=Bacillus massiliigorillae TaxID=1243664 RepID=UPI0005A6702E|nr:hypothetical protein [Bacillus massiliigorillae]